MSSSCIGLPMRSDLRIGLKDCLASDRPKLRSYYREACLEMFRVLLGRLFVSRQTGPGDAGMLDYAGMLESDARQSVPLCRSARIFEVEPELIRALECVARMALAEAEIHWAARRLFERSPPSPNDRRVRG